MGQIIQEWSKQNLWKTAFKKFELIWSAQADHITSNILKAVFHRFHLSTLKFFVPYVCVCIFLCAFDNS